MAGTTGYDYETMTISDDVAEQCAQTFRNIEKALAEAGASLADVVRVTYLLADRADGPACWPITRSYFADARPASTMLMAGLQDERMKIEIEVTARIGSAAEGS